MSHLGLENDDLLKENPFIGENSLDGIVLAEKTNRLIDAVIKSNAHISYLYNVHKNIYDSNETLIQEKKNLQRDIDGLNGTIDTLFKEYQISSRKKHVYKQI